MQRREILAKGASGKATIELRSAPDGQLVWSRELAAEPRSISFSPAGDLVAVLTAADEVYLFSALAGALLWRKSNDAVDSAGAEHLERGDICFTPSGELVLSWGLDNRLNARDVRSGVRPFVLQTSPGRFLGVAFSRDGRQLIATHETQPTSTWSLETGRRVSDEIIEPAEVHAVRFSPDFAQALLSGKSGVTSIVSTNRESSSSRRLRQAGQIRNAFFIPDSTWILTVSDLSVRLWDSRDGLSLGPELFAPSRIESALLTTDRRLMLSTIDGLVFQAPLQNWLSPMSGEWGQLRVNSELASSRRCAEDGSVQPLSTSEWLQRWQSQRK
jgi:WD40 repeat protein